MRRWAIGGVFEFEILEKRPGFLCFRVTGKKAHSSFENEAGGHRIQQIPTTERNGRVHTSTITIAVLEEAKPTELYIDERDLEYRYVRASGAGGQNVNKVSSAVQLTYKPTGLMVRCESQRSQLQNKEAALMLLRAKLLGEKSGRERTARNEERQNQVGSGERADKIRTYRFQDDVVTDHRTGKKARLSRVLKGFLEDLE